MEKPKFVYVTYINATPEKVWEGLTKPEFTEQYWGGGRIQSDWTRGASVKIIKPDGVTAINGEVLQADPPRLLSYTWIGCPRDKSQPEETTRVTFDITTAFDATKLTVTHDDFAPGSKLVGEVREGWQAVLSSLKTLLETGKPIVLNWKC